MRGAIALLDDMVTMTTWSFAHTRWSWCCCFFRRQLSWNRPIWNSRKASVDVPPVTRKSPRKLSRFNLPLSWSWLSVTEVKLFEEEETRSFSSSLWSSPLSLNCRISLDTFPTRGESFWKACEETHRVKVIVWYEMKQSISKPQTDPKGTYSAWCLTCPMTTGLWICDTNITLFGMNWKGKSWDVQWELTKPYPPSS